MSIQETSLTNRSLGALAFEYDKELLRYEDAKRMLDGVKLEQRHLTQYAAIMHEARDNAKAIRAVINQKLLEHDVRLGLRAA